MNFRLLPEWAEQDAVMLTWPHKDTDWADNLARVEPVYIELAKHITTQQQLVIVAHNSALKVHITALLNSDWMCPYKEHRFSIIGTKGSLIFDDTREWNDKLYFNPSTIKSDNTINFAPSKRIIVKKNEPLKNELEEFINAIQSRKNPITNYEEAINVQTVMEMIENNLENNQD